MDVKHGTIGSAKPLICLVNLFGLSDDTGGGGGGNSGNQPYQGAACQRTTPTDKSNTRTSVGPADVPLTPNRFTTWVQG